MKPWVRVVGLAVGGAFAVTLAAGVALWMQLGRREPPPAIASDEEFFKYGALSRDRGFPLYLWEAMQEVFADTLPPGGLAGFGFVFEPGRSLPVGMALTTYGFPGLTPNCALCHAGRVREAGTDRDWIVVGGRASQFDFDAFEDWAIRCAEDERFSAAALVPAIERRRRLGWWERLVYSWAIIPAVRGELLRQRSVDAWRERRPPPGPGRTDAFGRLKFEFLALPDDGSISTAVALPLWLQEAHAAAGMRTHWNGGGDDVGRANLLSSLTLVGKPEMVDLEAVSRVTNYLWKLASPRYPLEVDAGLAAEGRAVFERHCAECHGEGGARTGQVIPQSELGTDGRFLAMWTPAFVEALRGYDRPPFSFPGLRESDGYVARPLQGIWAGAPFLHNGSVPSLHDLLEPQGRRPASFRAGGGFDPGRVGLVVTGAGAGRFEFDTSLPGNGNGGHEYGTGLEPAEKRVLLEYLKTL